MFQVIETEKIPVKVWADDMDHETFKQARNLANLPVAFKWVAIMPDCHKGFGMPIGGVLAVENAILPNAVGVDIGCGMIAVRTSLQDIDKQSIIQILQKLKGIIPTGFKHHTFAQEWEGFGRAPDLPVIRRELQSARAQLGTLGGGNHFIEIQKEENGPVWLMLHSGSRNFGYQIAHEYNLKAKKFCSQYDISLPSNELPYFYFDSEEGQEYFTAMNYALEFAAANRRVMMNRFKGVIHDVTAAEFAEEINIHHNYAALEEHYGKSVVIHRKGATSAKEGQSGIIPGSQGTPSYIVRGLGNPESFMSCSHGAGRSMSRSHANKTIDENAAERSMKGIIHEKWRGHYDEAPQAYKNIDKVMSNQSDLVEIMNKLRPLGVMKGDAGLQV